jgi:menaquinone-9 beta-reductase
MLGCGSLAHCRPGQGRSLAGYPSQPADWHSHRFLLTLKIEAVNLLHRAILLLTVTAGGTLSYDIVVAGGGPSGSSAAWRAARAGARVVVCDKARFPRDKPCGDGLTPRAVMLLSRMGLEQKLERFHRVERIRFVAPGCVHNATWPVREGFPSWGYVASRVEFDEMLLRHAADAGAEVLEDCEAMAPLLDKDNVVCGVKVRQGDAERELHSTIVVAADGAYSPLSRAVGMAPDENRPFAAALRAQVEANYPEDESDALSIYVGLRHGGSDIPGYGWIFPMAEGRVNIGVGVASTFSHWRKLNMAEVMGSFLESLPPGWGLPSVDTLRESRALKGWRLPLGFTVWPPWRPGILAVGDAAGVIKPFSGSGISRAIHSGVVGAEVAVSSLTEEGRRDLGEYERRLRRLWGAHYGAGRKFVQLIGHPAVMRAYVGGFRIPMLRTPLAKLVLAGYRDQPEPWAGLPDDRPALAALDEG